MNLTLIACGLFAVSALFACFHPHWKVRCVGVATASLCFAAMAAPQTVDAKPLIRQPLDAKQLLAASQGDRLQRLIMERASDAD